MYKTIRHGENSLQYTILPQNDDFRIEGKLSSAGSSCSSGSGRKSKAKRPRRRSFFAYLGLIFVCTVIVGALLIPFLVSAERLPSPTEWFTKTKAALTKSNAGADGGSSGTGGGGGVSGNGVNVGKIIKIISKNGAARAVWGGNQTGVGGNPAPTATTTANATKPNTQQTYPSQNSSNIPSSAESEKPAVGNSVTIAAAEPVEAHQDQQPEVSAGGNDVQIASNLDKSNDQPLEPTDQTEHFVTEVRFEVPQSGDDPSAPHLSAIVPTIVVTTLRNSDSSPKAKPTPGQTSPMVRPTASLSASNVNAPHLPVGNSNGNVIGSQPAPPAIPTIMTRIIQVPLLKSASKKPVIPPVLAKTNSQYASGSPDGAAASAAAADNSHQPDARDSPVNTNVNAKSAGPNWINAHWPYIDPSTYFQWTGYKAEDSVLLPALLGFALIGMILIITVCLVARNKRTIVSSVRKRNRNDIEETGAEDNATLLTTTNLSDED